MNDKINTQIWQLHQSLGQTVQSLSSRLGKTADLEEAEAILSEIDEVNFRVMMTGRLLFRSTTNNLNRRIDEVVHANAKVDDEIHDLEKARDIVRTVGKFLGKVDKIVDSIKVLVG